MLKTNYANLSHNNFDRVKLQSQLLNLNGWQAKGVFSIKYGNKADSANYLYSQNGDDFKIQLNGFFGFGSLQIFGDKDAVTLVDSRGQATQAKNIKSLMLAQFGWYMPIADLRYWIKAIAAPNIKSDSDLNTNNLLARLSQSGWQISYQNYQIIDQKYPLPKKIKMSHDDILLTIIIKSWHI